MESRASVKSTRRLLNGMSLITAILSIVSVLAREPSLSTSEKLLFLLCSLCTLCAFRFLYEPLYRPIGISLLTWASLWMFFLFYYLKYWLFLLAPNGVAVILDRDNEYSNAAMLSGYVMVTLSFFLFALASRLALSARVRVPQETIACPNGPFVSVKKTRRLALLILCVIGYLLYKTNQLIGELGVGVMGSGVAGEVSLPFKLAGIILNIRVLAIPLLLLLTLFWALKARDLVIGVLVACMMFATSLSELFHRTSKSFMIVSTVLWALLVVLTRGRVTRKYMLVAAFLGIFLVAAYPFARAYRGYHYYYRDAPAFEAFYGLVQDRNLIGQGESLMLTGALTLLERAVGVESLLDILRFKETRDLPYLGLGVFFRQFTGLDASAYITQEVHGIDSALTGNAPGMLGFMYLVGGPAGIALGTFLFFLVIQRIWLRIYYWPTLRAKEFLQVGMVLFLYPYLIDGMFDSVYVSNILKIIGFLIILWTGERLTRTLVARHIPPVVGSIQIGNPTVT